MHVIVCVMAASTALSVSTTKVKRKGYDAKFKIKAIEFAEQNSNERAAEKFQVCAAFLSACIGKQTASLGMVTTIFYIKYGTVP